jgi:hypothetical protein
MGSVVWKLDNPAGKREKRDPRLAHGQLAPRAHPSGRWAVWRHDFMANRAIWSMRLRHEWLKTPLKKARFKRSQRIRVGLEDALVRKGLASPEQAKAK